MNTIEQIALNKPMDFTGYCFADGKFNLVTELTTLSINQTNTFLSFLYKNIFRKNFDENLQSISETKSGEPLLTGWMQKSSFEEFLSFSKNDSSIDPEVSLIIESLSKTYYSWPLSKITDVFFDGYCSCDDEAFVPVAESKVMV